MSSNRCRGHFHAAAKPRKSAAHSGSSVGSGLTASLSSAVMRYGRSIPMKSETPPAGPDAAWRSRPRGLACRRVPTACEWTPRTGTGTRALAEPPIPSAQARHTYGGGAAARGAFWPPMPPTWPDARCGGTVPSLSVQRRSKSSCPSGRPKKTCTRSSEHGCTGASGRPSPVSPHPKSAGEECEAARASPVMSSATTQPIAHTSTGGPYAVPAKAYSGAVPGVRLGRVSRQAPRETDQLRGRGPAAAYLRTSACPANGRGRGR